MNKVLTVFKKEIKDAFRDRRTLISSILIPALLIPVLFLLMGNSISGVQKSVKQEGFKVSFQGKNTYLEQFLSRQPYIKIVQSDNPQKMLQDGKIQAIIVVPDDFNSAIEEGKQVDLSILYDQSSSKSSMGLASLTGAIDAFSKSIANERLKSKGIDPQLIYPVVTKVTDIAAKKNGEGAFVLSFIIPLFLMMWPAIGAMISAADSGAGEKERGTLEPLLATQASRTAIAVGKWLAISIASLTGAVAFTIGLIISLQINPMAFGGKIYISILPITIMTILGVLVSLMYSAFMLALSIFARNTKEANTYMSPINIIAMVPAYLTFYTDIKSIPLWQYVIPFYNIVLVLKESLSGTVNIIHLGLAILGACILILLALIVAIKMFNDEKVIFRN
ncbi:sodium transport system permease protein [Caldanaerobius fijiensis DSM 17918]|uniref:Sodium transport system permease protein n=1 Tax=Caldanaerobius fijiensis DSM 17918 TaxID=1121256 RepID=A0A1M4X5P6_9THEO|nr:ABC transporter permease [Caldanaerobius fijiensis]SHE88800.1 sodium transport system permease protein [Caldanaerobius fijiensis DSM 17918]